MGPDSILKGTPLFLAPKSPKGDFLISDSSKTHVTWNGAKIRENANLLINFK